MSEQGSRRVERRRFQRITQQSAPVSEVDHVLIEYGGKDMWSGSGQGNITFHNDAFAQLSTVHLNQSGAYSAVWALRPHDGAAGPCTDVYVDGGQYPFTGVGAGTFDELNGNVCVAPN